MLVVVSIVSSVGEMGDMNARSGGITGSRERDWNTWQGYFTSERGLSAFYRFFEQKWSWICININVLWF
jgi:hypothetical protein